MLPTMALPAALSCLAWGVCHGRRGASEPWARLPQAGHGVFYYMPYLFAIGVAWGLSNQGGPAGLAALAGMFIYDQVISRLGDGSVQPSTLIGIIFGVMSGYVYNRFKHIKLPEAIQFLGLPIRAFVHGTVLHDICMDHAGDGSHGTARLRCFYDLTVHMGAFGLFLYGILYRVLTAFGLHHLLNNVYWFQLGSYETEDGTVVQGICPDSSRVIRQRATSWPGYSRL